MSCGDSKIPEVSVASRSVGFLDCICLNCSRLPWQGQFYTNQQNEAPNVTNAFALNDFRRNVSMWRGFETDQVTQTGCLIAIEPMKGYVSTVLIKRNRLSNYKSIRCGDVSVFPNLEWKAGRESQSKRLQDSAERTARLKPFSRKRDGVADGRSAIAGAQGITRVRKNPVPNRT